MAKKKAELEHDASRYYSTLAEMRHKHAQREFAQAVSLAAVAWEFVDGMMQYERKFEDRNERRDLECVNYVLRYAPLIFDLGTLTTLSKLLQTQKRVDKNTTADLAADLNAAMRRIRESHRLWNYIESNVTVEQDRIRTNLGGDQDQWRWIAEQWESMGLLTRVPKGTSYILSLSTRLETPVRAKCSACGVVAKAAKGRFWEQIVCPKCKRTVYFVILVSDAC